MVYAPKYLDGKRHQVVDIFYSGVGILNELSSEEMEEAFQKSLAEQAQGTFLMECALRPGRFLDNRSSPYYNLGDFEKGGDCLRAVLKKQIMILPGYRPCHHHQDVYAA